MLIDYRYHVGSFVAIFFALLLGILIGIGLAPNPEELDRQVASLKEEYRRVSEDKEAELSALREQAREGDMLAREAVAGVIQGRLTGKRVAIIVGHDFANDPLPDALRAALQQAGATVASTTAVTRNFASLPPEVRQRVSQRLSLYPPPGVHFRTVIAEAIAADLALGRAGLIQDLHTAGLLKSTADSDYTVRPDMALILGGSADPAEAAPERIDLPIIKTLTAAGIRVVGAQARSASASSIPTYKAAGIPTVDNADGPAGRLAVVLALAGADGHFGVSDTADSFLPPIPAMPPTSARR